MEPEQEHEARPLLHPLIPITWRQNSRHRCFRLPSERTITGVILALFLLVVLLLLLMQRVSYAGREGLPPFISDDILEDDFPEEILGTKLENSLRVAWIHGEKLVAARKKLEKLLFETGVMPQKDSPSSRLQAFQRSRTLSRNLSNCAIIVEHVRRSLGKCVNLTILPSYCKSSRPDECDPNYPYRTYNGSCNNLAHPHWGMSQMPFSRMIKADYADGVSLPRVSVNGNTLPSARLLSSKLYTHKTRPDCNCTLLFMTFGLFVDHDVARAAPTTGHDGAQITCCDQDVIEKPSLRHPECLEIDVPKFDPFFGPLDITCLDFIRSSPVSGTCAGQREQLNLISSYLDGSAVYGSSDEESHILRSFRHGRLLGCSVNRTLILPINRKAGYSCGTKSDPLMCFAAGDQRVNEQVELTAMHAIWFREHNRIVDKLFDLNPKLDDETLFQETRRIVVAEIQYILYNEYLPLLLGSEAVEKYNLSIKKGGDYDGYDENVDAGIYNVFGASAFRVGHSFIQGLLDLFGGNYKLKSQIPLHETFLNPDVIFHSDLDLLLRGLAMQRAQSVGTYTTSEIRNRLFQQKGDSFGTDLSALGIQRARDHGIAGYTTWRKKCELPEIKNWEDLYDIMDRAQVDRLRDLYMSVEDIDLTPGSLAENHMNGSMLGPTHICLLAKQFQRTRSGDRFWFEVRNKPWSFSKGQLKELYKSSMARIVCDNSDNLSGMQMFAFRTPSDRNPILQCSKLPEMDLSMWTNLEVFHFK